MSSTEEVFEWLRHLCLDSTCRGVGGHELATTPLTVWNGDRSAAPANARALRLHLVELYRGGEGSVGRAHSARLGLLGLSAAGALQPRPVRRKLAADILVLPVDTFRKGPENDLLRDVAADVWIWLRQQDRFDEDP